MHVYVTGFGKTLWDFFWELHLMYATALCDHTTPTIVKKLRSKGIAMYTYGVSVYYVYTRKWTWVEPFEMNAKIEQDSPHMWILIISLSNGLILSFPQHLYLSQTRWQLDENCHNLVLPATPTSYVGMHLICYYFGLCTIPYHPNLFQ